MGLSDAYSGYTLQPFKQGCSAQVGRLCIVQGHLAKRWMRGEICPRLFSPGHAGVGPVSTGEGGAFSEFAQKYHVGVLSSDPARSPHRLGPRGWSELGVGGKGHCFIRK